MSDFTTDWLSLRAPADARARASTGLDGMLCDALPDGPLRILDIGAGGGNNLRYLAGMLLGSQSWTLVDHDAALLDSVALPDSVAGLEMRPLTLDLADDLAGLPLSGQDLVTASAFFDLVSADWLDAFAAACVQADVATMLFTLTVDGRLSWQPEEAEDEEIATLFRQHMSTDKGFGLALGTDAPPAMAAAFQQAGYQVVARDSAWHLGPSDVGLQHELLTGYVGAAAALAPTRRDAFDDWAARRRAHIPAERAELIVGHQDFLIQKSL